jgi:hypothetical protein
MEGLKQRKRKELKNTKRNCCTNFCSSSYLPFAIGSELYTICIWTPRLLLLSLVTFMQCIYSYVPDTNHVYRVYSVAAILLLQFMVHVMLFPMINVLYFYISTFRSMFAVPSMAVFSSSLIRLLLLLLSPLCTVFTITYLKQTMFLTYIYNVPAILW